MKRYIDVLEVNPDMRWPDGNGLKTCNARKRKVKTHYIPLKIISTSNHLNAV
ncbi:hypothetical protein [uncultured Pedobacter sp.]|uniref:hypothetical protein n=1 Tax=uncultured Pedobacter sp. TaxID=246139 RepID=UPI0025F65159|nr:hypothetical protein [uncultured Pedobacter sp.]